MKDNKVLNFIFKHKAYVIILFLVVIAALSTSFALFRQDIIGQNEYYLEVADLSSSIVGKNIDSLTISLQPGEKLRDVKFDFFTSSGAPEVLTNFYYTSSSDLVYVGYTIAPSMENIFTLEGGIINGNSSTPIVLNIENKSDVEQTVTFGTSISFVNGSLEYPDGAKGIDIYVHTGLDDPSDTSSASEPVLIGDMIPVVYDEASGEWVKAGIGNWYNYDKQNWANAVTVTETNRSSLVNSEAGTVIPMEDINTMMVWIPRYSYTLGNTYGYQGYGGNTPSLETPGAFNIKFVNENITELGNGAYSGETASEWYTSSAFCWGNSCDDPTTRNNAENTELAGIWVAKFELAYEINTDDLLSKPNISSNGNYTMNSYFDDINNQMNNSIGQTTYGLYNNGYNAHAIKNTEWGAVAYLSQSKYGKYGNVEYDGASKEIYQNKSDPVITGNSNGSGSQDDVYSQCSYERVYCGVGASTTGNISGIYDMNGGYMEYVMGAMVDSSGNYTGGFSGPSFQPESKFYNIYSYGMDFSDITRRLLGDATGEVSGFYNDQKSFVAENYTWFGRGGYNNLGNLSGIFAYYPFGFNHMYVPNNSLQLSSRFVFISQ